MGDKESCLLQPDRLSPRIFPVPIGSHAFIRANLWHLWMTCLCPQARHTEGGGIVSHLQCLGIYYVLFPGRCPWAFLFRTFGALKRMGFLWGDGNSNGRVEIIYDRGTGSLASVSVRSSPRTPRLRVSHQCYRPISLVYPEAEQSGDPAYNEATHANVVRGPRLCSFGGCRRVPFHLVH